jgi:hypothetical protein
MATNDSTRYTELKARVEALDCRLLLTEGAAQPDGYCMHIFDPKAPFDTNGNNYGLVIVHGDDREIEAWCEKREKRTRPDAHAWQRGADLAIALLRDAERTSLDDADLKDDCRGGRPQHNIALSHLIRLRAIDDERVVSAFASVLTAYLVGTQRSGVPDVDAFAQEARTPIATTAEVAR